MIQSVTERDVSTMEWRVCPRFPRYEVSECGDLRRANREHRNSTRIKGSIDSDGYLRYAIVDETGKRAPVTAYRLVAEAFIGPQPSPAHEVAHNIITGRASPANFRDLRWATRQQNANDQQTHETAPKGEKNGHHKVTEDDVRFIRSEYRAIKNSRGARKVTELEDRFGLCRGQIIRIAKGDAWSHIPMENVA